MPMPRWTLALLPGLLLAAGPLIPQNDAPPENPKPRVTAVWPDGPLNVRVAFDRPVNPAIADEVTSRSIAFGPSTTDGEAANGPTPASGAIRIAAARLEDGARTLVLATDPHPFEARYRLNLPGFDSVAYDLSGVEASWSEDEQAAEPSWQGWWPHIEPALARARTVGSAEHERGFALLTRKGRLTLRTLVVLPEGKATLRLEADRPFEATFAFVPVTSSPGPGDTHRADLPIESMGVGEMLEVLLSTGDPGPLPTLRAQALVGDTPTPKPIVSKDLVLPWAPAPPDSQASPTAEPPYALQGGDPERGKTVFFSEEAQCSKCHKIQGEGSEVGPDLSELADRDPATIYADIANPSARIHPDYVPFTVALKDGQVAVGVVKAEGADAIRVLDNNAKISTYPRSEVEELRPSATSIMPVGLAGALGETKMRDLIAFLTNVKP